PILCSRHRSLRVRPPFPPRRSSDLRGQYEQGWLAGERVPGYLDEKDVPKDSKTETYAAVRLGIETRRWAGVPFYLRTGKRLPRRDRKSTRLNSSHGSISDGALCL